MAGTFHLIVPLITRARNRERWRGNSSLAPTRQALHNAALTPPRKESWKSKRDYELQPDCPFQTHGDQEPPLGRNSQIRSRDQTGGRSCSPELPAHNCHYSQSPVPILLNFTCVLTLCKIAATFVLISEVQRNRGQFHM